MSLHEKKCGVCRVGTPTLSVEQIQNYLGQVPQWAPGERGIERVFEFRDFAEALAFFSKVAKLAEEADHHPDMAIFRWKYVGLSLFSYAADGLTENDFIMAAKIDRL